MLMKRYAVLLKRVCNYLITVWFSFSIKPVDEGIYWSVNFNKFHQRFHDQVPSMNVAYLMGAI